MSPEVTGRQDSVEGISSPVISWVRDPPLRLKSSSARDDARSEQFWIS